jgi:hypothetical protein
MSFGVDTNWYMDSGARDHITRELDKLTIRDKYHGGDRVHAANGAGMKISHIGHGQGRIYISRDVTFDEHIYPFASLHPNVGARLKSELTYFPMS